jgi:hypothetical protein
MKTKESETGKDNNKGEEPTTPVTPETEKDLQIKELVKQVKELTGKVQGMQMKSSSSGVSADVIAAAVEGVLKAKSQVENYEGGIQEEQIPADDYDPKGVRFCYPSAGYVLTDDIRQGRVVNLPYNKKVIFFECAAEKHIKQGKYNEIAYVSTYTSHSKKEIEWIRKHSLYGAVIFESANEAMNQKAILASKIAKIMEVVQNYTYPDLLKRCDEYGVTKSEDPAILRANLAYKMADKQADEDMNRTRTMLADNEAQKKVLEGKQ